MNNNDLIRRGDVLARKEVMTEEFHEHGASMRISHSVVTVDNINAIPAAEQPMNAVEYERISRRFGDWCASTLCSECNFYDDCPQSSVEVLRELTPEQRVAAMQKWAQERPEEVKDEDQNR